MNKLSWKAKFSIGLIIAIVLLGTISFFINQERLFTSAEQFVKDYLLSPLRLIPKKNIENNDLLNTNYTKVLEQEIKDLQETLDLTTSLTNFEYVNATVISRNKGYYFNDFTIDKGKDAGIKEDMAVITSSGLIGKISKVTKYTSVVKLITSNDSNFMISLYLGDNYHGLLTGFNQEKNSLLVSNIQKTSDIKEGDSVITSGLGGVFPKGIYVGKITNITSDKYDMSKNAEIEVGTRFNNISYVTVLKRVK